MTDPVPTIVTPMVPMKITNRGSGALTVKAEDGDKTVSPGQTTDTHSVGATLDMIDEVKAEAQAKVVP